LKKKLLIFLLFVVFIAGYFFSLFYKAGVFKTIVSQSNFVCQKIQGAPGAEDIDIDRDNGILFISSIDRRKRMKDELVQGNLFSYDLNKKNAKLRPLLNKLPFDFNPHGISFYSNSNFSKEKKLFVINHRTHGNFIEVFSYQNNNLKHLKSISCPLMSSPNDIVAIDGVRFYVTNDHGFKSNFGKIAEDFLQLSRGYLLYYDGGTFTKVLGGFSYPNGVAIDRKKNILYLSETTGQRLHAYKINMIDGSLHLLQSIKFNSCLDNISINRAGVLYIANHPKIFDFLKHTKNPDYKSSSEVYKVVFDGKNFKSTLLYRNDGREISGSSVAFIYKKYFIIGSVFEDYFLSCKKK